MYCVSVCISRVHLSERGHHGDEEGEDGEGRVLQIRK